MKNILIQIVTCMYSIIYMLYRAASPAHIVSTAAAQRLTRARRRSQRGDDRRENNKIQKQQQMCIVHGARVYRRSQGHIIVICCTGIARATGPAGVSQQRVLMPRKE